MLIPIRTDRPLRRRPAVTQGLIILNLAVYLFGLVADYAAAIPLEDIVNFGHLWKHDFHLHQLVTYQFLHDPSDVFHVAFNMLFLWVFGCAVEDKLGRMSFLAFYLLGGLFAGVAHMMISDAPVIGASGAVAAVTGAFLALFPRSRIQLLVFFFLIGVFSVPSLWVIGFFFAVDVLRQFGSFLGSDSGNVAYMAHIVGYLYGFLTSLVLLATGIIARGEWDVLFLLKQARRRAVHRSATRDQAAGAWESAQADTQKKLEKRARKLKQPTEADERMVGRRTAINRLVDSHDLVRAAPEYEALLEEAPDAVLSEPRQLDLANYYFQQNRYETAARAYELFLNSYGRSDRAAEVRLMLALVYARHLNKPQRAHELAALASKALEGTAHAALAKQILAESST